MLYSIENAVNNIQTILILIFDIIAFTCNVFFKIAILDIQHAFVIDSSSLK